MVFNIFHGYFSGRRHPSFNRARPSECKGDGQAISNRSCRTRLSQRGFKSQCTEKLLTVSFSPDDSDNGTANVAWTRNEFVLHPFSKNFVVDESVDVNNISATYQNGILRISLAKNEPAKSLVKEIEIK